MHTWTMYTRCKFLFLSEWKNDYLDASKNKIMSVHIMVIFHFKWPSILSERLISGLCFTIVRLKQSIRIVVVYKIYMSRTRETHIRNVYSVKQCFCLRLRIHKPIWPRKRMRAKSTRNRSSLPFPSDVMSQSHKKIPRNISCGNFL